MPGYVFGVVNLSDSARAMESSKRQRREEASPASRVQGSGLPLLTSVSVVCRDATPQLQPLPHVISTINAFLDVTPSRTVEFACSTGLMHLLQRIIAGYEHHPDTSVERDPLFRQIQFSRGMTAACKAGHLTIVQWLAQLPYFEACFMPYQAVRYAMTRGRLDVLKWLHANRTDICWRLNLVVVNGRHLDVSKWLQPMAGRYENFGRLWIVPAAEAGNLEMVKWAYHLKGRTPANTRKAVQVAAENGHLHVVLWLLEQTGSNAPKDTNVSGLLKEGLPPDWIVYGTDQRFEQISKRFAPTPSVRQRVRSLECSSLGPPPQIPRGPASRAPRAGLLWLRSSQPLTKCFALTKTKIRHLFQSLIRSVYDHK